MLSGHRGRDSLFLWHNTCPAGEDHVRLGTFPVRGMPVEQYHGARDRVRFGQTIMRRDSKNAGTVEPIALNARHNHLEQLVAEQGILKQPKRIDIGLFERIEPDRIVLNLTAGQAESLPDFAVTQYVEAPGSAPAELGPAWDASARGDLRGRRSRGSRRQESRHA